MDLSRGRNRKGIVQAMRCLSAFCCITETGASFLARMKISVAMS
jgi:hypothetical protein